MFKKLFISLMSLSIVGVTALGIVSCSKQANASLPIEYIITSENLKFRTDRTDGRTIEDSWLADKQAQLSDAQKAFGTNVVQNLIGVLKSVLTGYSADYSQVDEKWKPLLSDINAQRSGGNSLMIEMSRMHFKDLGTLNGVAILPNNGGILTIQLTKIEFDAYATNGNSPNEAFNGLLPRSAGHHYEVDLSNNPIVTLMGFTNSTKDPISTIDKIPFGAPTSYVVSSSENIIEETEFKQITSSVPAASNYYKSKITDADFKKIFGKQSSPSKILS